MRFPSFLSRPKSNKLNKNTENLEFKKRKNTYVLHIYIELGANRNYHDDENKQNIYNTKNRLKITYSHYTSASTAPHTFY